MEVERLRFRVFRRPCGITAPHIGSGLEDVGLRQFRIGLAFEILLEEREKNVLAVEIAGVCRELGAAKVVAIEACPAAVNPGSDNKRVENVMVVLVDRVESAERALQVFGVEP